MDDTSFRCMAVDSAQRYLCFLEQEDKGTIITEVISITKRSGEAFLHLRGRLSPVGIDTLRLRISADEFSTKVANPVEYHSERNILILRPQREVYDLLPSGKCSHVFVISDLRFLVERVRDWYLADRPPICLPRRSPNVLLPSLDDMAGGVPTDAQYSAVCNVLTVPFSYVWGAPGTGKTRFVLANCVLAYLREDKKVLLTAPTNNALEQMLFGILEVLSSCGFSTRCILRLGVPSAAFAAQYPECCERLSSQSRQASIEAELTRLKNHLQNAAQFAALTSAQTVALGFHERLQEILAQFQSSAVPQQELDSARAAADRAQEATDTLEDTIQSLTVWLNSLPGRLARFFRPALYSEKSALLKTSTRELDRALRARADMAKRYNELAETAMSASRRYYEQLEDLREQWTEAFQDPPIPELSIPFSVPPDAFPAQLSLACDTLQAAVAKAPIPDDLNDDEVADKIRILEAELASLNTDHLSRVAEVRVLAMTIDRFISPNGSPSAFGPEHVFMDEAAYCSLIKGYPLLSLSCPVTLLGDHTQLPPVCEMSESAFKKAFRTEFLWAQSAIHLDSVFQHSDLELYYEYIDANPPCFRSLQLNALAVTHRFGPGLSRILSAFIYNGHLTSARATETDIWYIHSPSSPKDKGRTSQAECDAITLLAKELLDNGTDFAILTPYRQQVALLSKAMPHLSAAGRIMTIHASQGREFHTVILSVVDTSDMFFTDSSNSTGRAVLNTAVSRVKSDLILALDCDYWYTQQKQLLSQLLRIATPRQILRYASQREGTLHEIQN